MTNSRRFTIVALAIMVLAGACRTGRTLTPEAELRAAVSDLAPVERFRFVYNAGGTSVNDCFQPNQSFLGDVDLSAGLLVIRHGAEGPPIALVAGGRAVLNASLFRAGTAPTPWLATSGPVEGPLRAGLVRALGTGLAGYVVDAALPPDGAAFASDGLTIVEAVKKLPPRDGAQRFLLRLDGNRLSAPGATSPDAPVEDPTLEIWFEGGVVRRITVVPGRSASDESDLELGGWTIDYQDAPAPGEVPDLGPVTELTDVDAAALAAPPITTCELPLSTDR